MFFQTHWKITILRLLFIDNDFVGIEYHFALDAQQVARQYFVMYWIFSITKTEENRATENNSV